MNRQTSSGHVFAVTYGQQSVLTKWKDAPEHIKIDTVKSLSGTCDDIRSLVEYAKYQGYQLNLVEDEGLIAGILEEQEICLCSHCSWWGYSGDITDSSSETDEALCSDCWEQENQEDEEEEDE